MTSLATQLQALSANNVTVIDREKRKKLHSVSLIFEPKVAQKQDFETIYGVGLEGLRQLEEIDSQFEAFETTLFSENSVRLDRNVQTIEQNQLLDKAIENFMTLAAPLLNLEPTVKAIEWLVRRFQVHIQNAETLLLAVLPYYSQPVFLRFLDVVTLPQRFQFLNNAKKGYKNPPRNLIVRAFASEPETCQLVNEYTIKVISHGRGFHQLLAFWSSMCVWTMVSMRDFNATDEQVADRFLPYISSLIRLRSDPDAQIAAYMVLAVLSCQFRLLQDIRRAAIQSIALNWTVKSVVSGLACISQLVNAEDKIVPFGGNEWTEMTKIKDFTKHVTSLASKYRADAFVAAVCVSYLAHQQVSKAVDILSHVTVADVYMTEIVQRACQEARQGAVDREALVQLFEKCGVSQGVFEKALEAESMDVDMLEMALQTGLQLSWTSETVTSSASAERDDDNAMEVDDGKPAEPIDTVKGPSLIASFLVADEDVEKEFRQLVSVYGHLISTSPSANSVDVLSNLMLNMDNGVSFFARVWSSNCPHVLRVHALDCVGQVFEQSKSVDYQGVIPLLLTAFLDESVRIRKAGGVALEHLVNRYPMKKPEFWQMDTVYGAGELSADVKWLGGSEVSKIVKAVWDRVEECYLDKSFITGVLSELARSSSKTGDNLGNYFSSHVNAVQLASPKTQLLQLCRGFKHMVKKIEPVLSNWIQDRPAWERRERHGDIQNLETELVNLCSSDRHGVAFLERCLKTPYDDLNDKAGDGLVKVWPKLKEEGQLDLFKMLCDLAVDDNNPYDSVGILHRLDIPVSLFVTSIEGSKLTTTVPDKASMAKRRRRSSSNKVQKQGLMSTAEKHLRKITLILEILDKTVTRYNEQSVSGAASKTSDLVTLLGQLFGVLGEILALGTEANLPIEYTQQLLASCMTGLVEELKRQNHGDVSQIDSGKMRVDIVVSCIRASSSPQVQNRFLLLIASLASLVPETVLHSVMPIFTFMGANTVRQDDEFSAHVIQQTIGQVVPALVGKEAETDFVLLSFVAAFPHIPRHRRVRMFGAIVRCLDVDHSLARLLFLLAEKYVDARVKRKSGDAKSLVQFTQMFINTFTVSEQLVCIREYLDLIKNAETVQRGGAPGSSLSADANSDASQDEEEQDGKKKPINVALLYGFIESSIPEELGARLIDSSISNTDAESCANICAEIMQRLLAARKSEELDADALNALTRLTGAFMEHLPIYQFVQVVATLLQTGPELVKRQALSLVQRKFADEIPTDERVLKSAAGCMDIHEAFLQQQQCIANAELSSLVLDNLEAIVSEFGSHMDPDQLCSRLDAALGKQGLQSGESTVFVSAVGYVSSICKVLGARMIGYFGRIVPVVFARLESDLNNATIGLATFGLIAGLVRRIPSFMVSSIGKTFELMFKSTNEDIELEVKSRFAAAIVESSVDVNSLIKALRGSIEAALTSKSAESVELFCDILDGTVAKATRKTITVQASTLVDIIIELFSSRDRGLFDNNSTNRVETRAIASALAIVLKLNDKTFRPQFIRIVQWATLPSMNVSRLTVMYKFVVKLIGNLKSIVTSYYGYLLDTSCSLLETLTATANATKSSEALTRAVLNSLVLSFQHDHDDFWTSQERFDKISKCLLDLYKYADSVSGPLLVKAVVALAGATAGELHKTINDGLCIHMKSTCTSTEKLWVSRTLHGLYDKLGEEWVSHLPQLVPLIAELLEDDDEAVELEVRRKLVPVVEDVLGESLDRYLA